MERTELGRYLLDAAVILVAAATWLVLSRPRISKNNGWRATVTPLASIIGSGFLVVAPLLAATVGSLAVVAMLGIVLLAYAVGSAVRYNVAEVEELIESGEPDESRDRALFWMGRVAKLSLAAAYVIAVTFYLELLGAFALRLGGVQHETLQKALASALLVFIGAFGAWRGLSMLESLETRAVTTKLGVILALLAGLLAHDSGLLFSGSFGLPDGAPAWTWTTVRQLLGAFLIVQGFETSRYLRGEYPAHLRIRTMSRAQLISAGIYVVFVGLATTLFDQFEGVSETGIIDLSEKVAGVLPALLVVGAVMSQFSAAVADTIASGGLVEEVSRDRVNRRAAYVGVVVLALALLWTADIFSVIAYASRAFAAYYALQCAMAALHAATSSRRLRAAWFALLALLMVLTAVFGIPAETRGG